VNQEVRELHPSQNLEDRARGFGIGGGYERPLRRIAGVGTTVSNVYGTVPPSGYYGGGVGQLPFEFGKANFGHELGLYPDQYGREAIGRVDKS